MTYKNAPLTCIERQTDRKRSTVPSEKVDQATCMVLWFTQTEPYKRKNVGAYKISNSSENGVKRGTSKMHWGGQKNS